MAKPEQSFALRRLHSLIGVLPIGVFLLQHLFVNHFAVYGPESFNRASDFMGNLPLKLLLETVVIYIPILFHAIYGVYIAFTSRNNIGHYSTFRNWMFLLQRVTGVITFIFIAVHVWQTRVQVAFGHHVDYSMMHELMTNPFYIGFYVIGILSTVFHFANGLWSFAITWGITQNDKSQRIMTYVSLVVFLAVSALGLTALFAFI
ncbi:succinate dehydrogenase cytochrome b558 subunit [Macrococcus equipercicus]|uniref:Succinate dehydrogenase n=1 Tax=Macrococcus equipercicus TaxID=69967 RepID=A0A9Q9BM69_9STAP|nr:succinate dehydrogenase cytochrome b558 subunit [Macrococcus equipercicus]KAA1039972.1 succinate dehydrogenase [Macrococcus equipercicus]UTH13095.1 succinate dehydrogenase cytochrome b558 subunit [Macrococcus equipercicus]